MVFRGHVGGEWLTLTRLLQTHQGRPARDRQSKEPEKSREKINVTDDPRAGSAGSWRGGRRFTFLPLELRSQIVNTRGSESGEVKAKFEGKQKLN